MKITTEDFNFISDPQKVRIQGYIAQDLYKIYPEAVMVGGDDPKVKPWAVDYGRLTPLIVKAVQELKASFDTNHAALAALQAANYNQAEQLRDLRAEFEDYKRSHP